MNFKIIVIEDEFSTNDILNFQLKGDGYNEKLCMSSQKVER
ncbi:hypothetical protein [Clostridium scatologenes]|uniref:Uncharacterized protein n=1 Tax=Clostridium scatologenes TaxID=1548 RepID=A0A0E3GR33_CLOSL|nr:hypothetical protein [Clostridium scatologenes]AKA69621.1 hypothetical protein CSCA_2496 [Clostridium scatologenes]